MSQFIIVDPFSKIPNGLIPIESEPTLKYEVYIFSKKEISFEEVLKIYLRPFHKNDYLGAMSLIYFKYYNELYEFLTLSSQEPKLVKKYKKATIKFYKNYLNRWIDFIKYSDDNLYPQNKVFKEMAYVIESIYLNK